MERSGPKVAVDATRQETAQKEGAAVQIGGDIMSARCCRPTVFVEKSASQTRTWRCWAIKK